MSAATEKELTSLHKKVAEVLINKLNSADVAQYLLSKHKDLPEDVAKYLDKQTESSPALLAVITKFLKDNEITAVIEEDTEMSDLDKLLKQKRQRRTVGSVVPIRSEDED